ncbi:MAG TPA: hypothetical protein V6D05_16085 [Stenomitos sp.]
MLRSFSWLLAPVMLVSLAPAAWADVVIAKSGERVFGTILTETPVGVSILDLNGLTHGFYIDEVATVRRDPATRTAAGVAAVLEKERLAAEAEYARLSKEQQKREAPLHLGHQLTVGAVPESANTFLVGGGAKYRLLVGKYLGIYVGGNYGTGLGRLTKSTFDPDTGDVVATQSVTASAIDVPFGVEVRYQGLYVGGGATYFMGTNVPTKEVGVVKNVTTVLPQFEFGYAYQFKQGPLEVGPVVGVEARYALPNKDLGTGFYGGLLYGGWTF